MDLDNIVERFGEFAGLPEEGSPMRSTPPEAVQRRTKRRQAMAAA